MIPRLGDGNIQGLVPSFSCRSSLENDSPSRGRKLREAILITRDAISLENDSPSRGRKQNLEQT